MHLYRARRDAGAAAVEMALILPVLLLVLGGIIDVGRAMYGQIIIGNAAREGVRMLAMKYPTAEAEDRARLATGGLTPLVASTDVPPGVTYTPVLVCTTSNDTARMDITIASGASGFRWYMLDVVPRLVGGNIPTPTLKGTASMRCGG